MLILYIHIYIDIHINVLPKLWFKVGLLLLYQVKEL